MRERLIQTCRILAPIVILGITALGVEAGQRWRY